MRDEHAVRAHQQNALHHLQERHEIVVLRVVVQPPVAEAPQVVSEDRVLDEEVDDVVVVKGEIGHLPPEREDVDASAAKNAFRQARSTPPHQPAIVRSSGVSSNAFIRSLRQENSTTRPRQPPPSLGVPSRQRIT